MVVINAAIVLYQNLIRFRIAHKPIIFNCNISKFYLFSVGAVFLFLGCEQKLFLICLTHFESQ